jgi:hypothetical protein
MDKHPEANANTTKKPKQQLSPEWFSRFMKDCVIKAIMIYDCILAELGLGA